VRQAAAGRIVASRVVKTHPEWFVDEVIPRLFTGKQYWDDEGRWVGNVISNYGIIYNRDALSRIGVSPPAEWRDLTDPRYAGALALSDPTKSSSMAKAFENILQQEMQRRLASRGATGENGAVRGGWIDGLHLIQQLAANARYFTDSSQKPPIDVAQGDCAAGICIDFYGRAQAEAVDRRGGGRLEFVTPRGGTVNSVDPIALLRGAPHREVAERFIEYTLTMEAQKLWNFRVGTPAGRDDLHSGGCRSGGIFMITRNGSRSGAIRRRRPSRIPARWFIVRNGRPTFPGTRVRCPRSLPRLAPRARRCVASHQPCPGTASPAGAAAPR
jgi:ABC-type Fe3+ transport system substrate-binding protein